jgi:hypothetical protein
MIDANLESLTKQYAAGLQIRGFWVSPESDWKLWRVRVDGAAAILGVAPKTLANARSDPSSLYFRLPYIRARNGAQYLILECVLHESRLRLDEVA